MNARVLTNDPAGKAVITAVLLENVLELLRPVQGMKRRNVVFGHG